MEKTFYNTLEQVKEIKKRLDIVRKEYKDALYDNAHPRTLAMKAEVVERCERKYQVGLAVVNDFAKSSDPIFIFHWSIIQEIANNSRLYAGQVFKMPIQARHEAEAREIFKYIEFGKYADIEPIKIDIIRFGVLIEEKNKTRPR